MGKAWKYANTPTKYIPTSELIKESKRSRERAEKMMKKQDESHKRDQTRLKRMKA